MNVQMSFLKTEGFRRNGSANTRLVVLFVSTPSVGDRRGDFRFVKSTLSLSTLAPICLDFRTDKFREYLIFASHYASRVLMFSALKDFCFFVFLIILMSAEYHVSRRWCKALDEPDKNRFILTSTRRTF